MLARLISGYKQEKSTFLDELLKHIDKYISHKEFEIVFKDRDFQMAREPSNQKGKERKRRWSPKRHQGDYCQKGIWVLQNPKSAKFRLVVFGKYSSSESIARLFYFSSAILKNCL